MAHMPHSRRRVRKLYYLRGEWYSQKCLRFGYANQSEDVVARMWRRKAKLEARLDDDMEKSKGMHWDTYHRIINKWNETTENRVNYAFVKHMRQLMSVV